MGRLVHWSRFSLIGFILFIFLRSSRYLDATLERVKNLSFSVIPPTRFSVKQIWLLNIWYSKNRMRSSSYPIVVSK